MTRFLGLLALFSVLSGPVLAQGIPNSSTVVSSCGGVSYSAGQNRPTTQDTLGNTCTNGTSTVVIPGSVTVVQPTAANLKATVVGTGTFAVQATQSGTWNSRTQDGSGNTITSTTSALDVNIKGSTGSGGLATSANQTSVQSAPGTPQTTALTIQGNASGISVPVIAQAGSNIIGKVSIDQTTPGTTNAVKATNFPTTVDTNLGAAGASTLRTAGAIGSTFSPAQSTLSTSASLLLASGSYVSRIACNLDPLITIYIGASGVTSSTGMPVLAGGCWDVSHTSAAIYAVAASGAPVAAGVQY